MATTTMAAGAGFRHLRVYALNPTTGLLLVPTPGADGYGGLQASLAKALTLNVPDPQILQHTGDDRVGATDMLPPTEAIGAEIRTAHWDLDLNALLSNINVVQAGEMNIAALGTSQLGLEPNVAILGYRQSVDTDPVGGTKGARRWNWVMLPQAQVFPKLSPMEEQAVDVNTFTVNPKIVSKYPWGIAFDEGVEAYYEAQVLYGISQHRPHLEAWEGDGAVLIFNLPTGFEAAETSRMTVWHYVASTGVTTDVTSTVTLAVDSITFGTAPAVDDIVTCFFERAD